MKKNSKKELSLNKNIINLQEKIKKLNEQQSQKSFEKVNSKYNTFYDDEADTLSIKNLSMEVKSRIDEDDIIINTQKEEISSLTILDFKSKKDKVIIKIKEYFPDYLEGNLKNILKELKK
jgi:hypothetical protein